ncbi:MAG: hypothetical protein LBB81_05490 [Treponema sp.]|jgi:hypothetical protein|nr:hypothetical protein [Treponema sp.]
MNLTKLLLKNIFYKKDTNDEYLLIVNNEFIESDINELIAHITAVLENTFMNYTYNRPFLFNCKTRIDHLVLKQVLLDYSGDVFGQSRSSVLLKKLPNHKNIFDKMEKFGFKSIPSIHKYNLVIYKNQFAFNDFAL